MNKKLHIVQAFFGLVWCVLLVFTLAGQGLGKEFGKDFYGCFDGEFGKVAITQGDGVEKVVRFENFESFSGLDSDFTSDSDLGFVRAGEAGIVKAGFTLVDSPFSLYQSGVDFTNWSLSAEGKSAYHSFATDGRFRAEKWNQLEGHFWLGLESTAISIRENPDRFFNEFFGETLVGVAAGAGSARALSAGTNALRSLGKARGVVQGSRLSQIDEFVDLTQHRSVHILNRHRAGAGKPGKTEFPADWSDERILHQVSDIATDPNAVRGVGKYNLPYAISTRDGVEIRVDFYPDDHPRFGGQISTAYPTNVPANP